MIEGGPSFKPDISFGNIVSWIVMLLAAAVMYGVLKTTVDNNSKNNDRQDATIIALTTTLGALQITSAEANQELKQLRETLLRIEAQQREQWVAQMDQWKQQRQRDGVK